MKNSVWPSGARAGELLQRRNEIAAGLVLDDDSRLHVLAHLLGDQAGHHVGAAAGREADDHADRLAGQFLRLRRQDIANAPASNSPAEDKRRKKDVIAASLSFAFVFVTRPAA